MARKQVTVRVKLNSQLVLRKLLALMSLLAFFIVVVAALKAGVGFYWATVRATMVMVGFKLVSVVILRVLSTYEEMNSGQE